MTIALKEHDNYAQMISGIEHTDMPFTPITQSSYYGDTVLIRHNLRSRYFSIHNNEKKLGFFLLSDFYTMGGFYRRSRLDRGPIWFTPPTDEQQDECASALRELLPKRLMHKTIWMPEIYDTEISLKDWRKKKHINAYETCLLDLSPSLEILRKNLKQKWRNALNKSEKSDLTITIDDGLKYSKEFLLYYKRDKNYDGPSTQFLDLLMKKANHQNALNCVRVTHDNRVVSMALFFHHNNSATYQAAWQSNMGRKFNAGYLTLWSGLKHLKENHDLRWLDMGGLNREHASGLTRFKEGLNGKTIKLIGNYF